MTLDTYRAANLLVKRHGEDAPIEAANRAVGNVPGRGHQPGPTRSKSTEIPKLVALR